MPLVHARDAAEAKVAAIGTVNPRPPGLKNSIAQFFKKTIARALDWHVREQVEFNRAAMGCVQASLEALAETNRALAALASHHQALREETDAKPSRGDGRARVARPRNSTIFASTGRSGAWASRIAATPAKSTCCAPFPNCRARFSIASRCWNKVPPHGAKLSRVDQSSAPRIFRYARAVATRRAEAPVEGPRRNSRPIRETDS